MASQDTEVVVRELLSFMKEKIKSTLSEVKLQEMFENSKSLCRFGTETESERYNLRYFIYT